MTQSTYLELKWSISRGRDTFGYNIVTLTDTTTGKRYRCMGGGYDMRGTVFGEWLQDVYQDELLKIGQRASARLYLAVPGGEWLRTNHDYREDGYLYGMTLHDEPSKIKGDAARGFRRISVTVDGACGFDSMRKIAETIGLTASWANVDRKGNARGIIVESN